MYTVDGVLHINPTCSYKTTATIVLIPRDAAGQNRIAQGDRAGTGTTASGRAGYFHFCAAL